jgi:hypothetical protein
MPATSESICTLWVQAKRKGKRPTWTAAEQDSSTNHPLSHFEWRLPTRADEPLEIPENWNGPIQH